MWNNFKQPRWVDRVLKGREGGKKICRKFSKFDEKYKPTYQRSNESQTQETLKKKKLHQGTP